MRQHSAVRVPEAAITGALIVVAALDVWILRGQMSRTAVVLSGLGLLCSLAARRFPVAVFVCNLPAVAIGLSPLVPAIAAYHVGRYTKRPRVVAACLCGALAILIWRSLDTETLLWRHFPVDPDGRPELLFSDLMLDLMFAAAPILLGRLVASRIEVQERLAEIVRGRAEREELHTQAALARDRAQLAREMHDVVSHQVSLIAVQAGALEMNAPDAQTERTAATVRELSRKTLDELRYMVTVLRASGTAASGLAPQPTVTRLPALIRDSGLDVSIRGELPPDLPAAEQRAIYRTVQEGLTNVRKYAPDARVTVEFGSDRTEVIVAVLNTPGSGGASGLPSGGHGLRGLRERAELLEGTLTAGPRADGGFGLELRLPRVAAPAS
ncbi:sensor histidine kinase [Nocardia sp. NPDC088792]|uniref:sensor histidine kinase n=1 Tax=Nocardia sp. NPDC088792 TaxID=3364332 RepID=UPI0038287817